MGKQHINAELVILWILNIRVLLLLLSYVLMKLEPRIVIKLFLNFNNFELQ